MNIDKKYLAKILNTRNFYSKLREAGIFTYETDKEAGFLVVKQPDKKEFKVSDIKKGDYFTLYVDDKSRLNMEASESSYKELGGISDRYVIVDIHTHPGSGQIVPSLTFHEHTGDPHGDLCGLKGERELTRKLLGYDVKPIMGIAKVRAPTQIDILLVQERTDRPLGFGDLLIVEDALRGFYESERINGLEESYRATQEVAESLKATGLYSAEQIRYRGGRPLKEDLEKLVAFEFDEVKLTSI